MIEFILVIQELLCLPETLRFNCYRMTTHERFNVAIKLQQRMSLEIKNFSAHNAVIFFLAATAIASAIAPAAGSNWQRAYASSDWSEPEVLDERVTADAPALAKFDGQLYMAWMGRGSDTRVSVSAFDGKSWTEPEVLDGTNTSNNPALVAYQGKLYMAWKHDGDDMRISWSAFDGKSWSDPEMLDDSDTSNNPALAVYRGDLYIAWKHQDDTGISLATFDGKEWSDPAVLDDKSTSDEPALATFHGQLYLAWKNVGDDTGISWSAFS